VIHGIGLIPGHGIHNPAFHGGSGRLSRHKIPHIGLTTWTD